MSFWQHLVLLGTLAVVLAFFLVVHWFRSKKFLEEEARANQELLSQIEREQNETRRKVAEANQRVAELNQLKFP